MAYIGIGNRQDYIADFQAQNFSGDGSTTAFTLNYEAVTGSIRVAVDNVLQPADGSSYTVNGFTLNFTAAPASGTNNITVLFLGTVRNVSSVSDGAIVTAKIADGAVTEAKLASGVNTITMAEQWRLSGNVVTSTNTFLTTNIEKADSSDAGDIGTGMSESSGVFSFPSTGIYLIIGTGAFYQSGSVTHEFVGLEIYVTKDNSTYTRRASSYGAILGTNEEANTTCMFIVDVTDISNDKVKFHVRQQTAGNLNVAGNTNRQLTGFTFVRLGDT